MIYEQEDSTSGENENQIGDGGFKRLKRAEAYQGEQAIIPHISRKHHELGRFANLKYLYFQATYNPPTTMKAHIHTRVCTKRKEIQTQKNWIEIWGDACDVNKLCTRHQFNTSLANPSPDITLPS